MSSSLPYRQICQNQSSVWGMTGQAAHIAQSDRVGERIAELPGLLPSFAFEAGCEAA